jgi:hypothetical protein
MVHRALLIGITADDLPGVAEGVEAMARVLERQHDFTELTRLIDPTGPQIRQAFGVLARATRPGDAVVVYYAGHGSVFRAPLVDGEGHVCHIAVMPPDLHATRLGEFRGLLGTEISRLIRVLTDRSDNVTVILDCCYAADMLRIEDDGIDDPVFLAVEEETRTDAAAKSCPVQRGIERAGTSGARAVLLLASASGGRSFPDPDPDRRSLLFTSCLIEALGEDRDRRATWLEIIRTVRRKLRQQRRAQLPGVTGARYRRPFTVEDGRPGPGFVAADVQDDGMLTVDAGSFAGVREHEAFDVYHYTRDAKPTMERIARARVLRVEPGRSLLHVHERARKLPRVVYIRPDEHARDETPIVVDPGVAAALVGRERAWLPTGAWRGPRGEETPAVRLGLDDAAIVARDHEGERFALVEPASREAAIQVLARARHWWRLDSKLDDPEMCTLGDCFEARWGLLDARDGSERELAPDAVVPADTAARMFLHVRNIGVYRRLYVRAYRVCVDREIVEWEDVPDGVCIESRSSRHIGDQTCGAGRGIALSWPGGVPRAWFHGEPAREKVLLCVSNAPIHRDFLPRALAPGDDRATRGFEDMQDTDAAHYSLLHVAYRLAP